MQEEIKHLLVCHKVDSWGPGSGCSTIGPQDHDKVPEGCVVFYHPVYDRSRRTKFPHAWYTAFTEKENVFVFPYRAACKVAWQRYHSGYREVSLCLEKLLPKGWKIIGPSPLKLDADSDLSIIAPNQRVRVYPYQELQDASSLQLPESGKPLMVEAVVCAKKGGQEIEFDGMSLKGPMDAGEAIKKAVRTVYGMDMPFRAFYSNQTVLDVQVIPLNLKVAESFWLKVERLVIEWRKIVKMEEELLKPRLLTDVPKSIQRHILRGNPQKIRITEIEEMDWMAQKLLNEEWNWKFQDITRAGKSFVKQLTLSEKKEETTTFWKLVEGAKQGGVFYRIDIEPTKEEDGQKLYTWIRSIVQKHIPWFDGPYLLPEHGTAQFYVGQQFSSTPLHRDKGSSVAYNVLVQGKKKWLFIDPQDKFKYLSKFNHEEARAEKFRPTYEQLENAGIRYYVVHQNVGDCIVVPPNVLHMVVNIGEGTTIAYAWDLIPEKWAHAAFMAQYNRSTRYGIADTEEYNIVPAIVAAAKKPATAKAKREEVRSVAVALYKMDAAYCDLLSKLGWEVIVQEDQGREEFTACNCCRQACMWGEVTLWGAYKHCLGCFYKVYVGFGNYNAELAKTTPLTPPVITFWRSDVMVELIEQQEQEQEPVQQQQQQQKEGAQAAKGKRGRGSNELSDDGTTTKRSRAQDKEQDEEPDEEVEEQVEVYLTRPAEAANIAQVRDALSDGDEKAAVVLARQLGWAVFQCQRCEKHFYPFCVFGKDEEGWYEAERFGAPRVILRDYLKSFACFECLSKENSSSEHVWATSMRIMEAQALKETFTDRNVVSVEADGLCLITCAVIGVVSLTNSDPKSPFHNLTGQDFLKHVAEKIRTAVNPPEEGREETEMEKTLRERVEPIYGRDKATQQAILQELDGILTSDDSFEFVMDNWNREERGPTIFDSLAALFACCYEGLIVEVWAWSEGKGVTLMNGQEKDDATLLNEQAKPPKAGVVKVVLAQEKHQYKPGESHYRLILPKDVKAKVPDDLKDMLKAQTG